MKKILNKLKVLKSFLLKKQNITLNLRYEDYIQLQLEKTLDPERIKKWKNGMLN